MNLPKSQKKLSKIRSGEQGTPQKTKKLSRSTQQRRQSKGALYLDEEIANDLNENANADNPSLDSFFESSNNSHCSFNVSTASGGIPSVRGATDSEKDTSDRNQTENLLDRETIDAVGTIEHPRRRFSNLSNLAQSLPSTSSSVSALMHSRAGLGSVDLAAILNRGRSRVHSRRGCTEEEREEQGLAPVSIGSSASNVRRTQSVLVTCSSAAAVCMSTLTPHSPHNSEITKKPKVIKID